VKKFFLVVVGVVAIGLALRFTINKKKEKPKAPKPPVAVNVPPPDEPVAPDHPETPTPTPAPTQEPEAAPEPPRIAGSVMLNDIQTRAFATAPGVVYYCGSNDVMFAQSKIGGAPVSVGECPGDPFDMEADAQGVAFCNDTDRQLMRITAGSDNGTPVVTDGLEGCILMAVDGKWAYFVVPGFEGIEKPGLYRVLRSGGTPEKIHATRPKEQFLIAVDDEAVWIGAWAAGTISKLGKTPGSKARTIVTGQKGIVDVEVDATYLYWYAEGTGEVRRRK
jgi:hypothetical protein